MVFRSCSQGRTKVDYLGYHLRGVVVFFSSVCRCIFVRFLYSCAEKRLSRKVESRCGCYISYDRGRYTVEDTRYRRIYYKAGGGGGGGGGRSAKLILCLIYPRIYNTNDEEQIGNYCEAGIHLIGSLWKIRLRNL
ncbi:uncharacterized protein LOC122497883 [Leptopilina heterotoma]|uniref:uncharacterized protein LOC122497883 n=1 Tax=Leptopilina heterotoma TaxID=63436 RepID=UPI001CA84F6C|nr:uncharacterized protein LOC122497883 [Leptopilina heterotoma]XP_043461193.1 uncharacterized protein LOC122497883 [Leptopilina heterotoma]XP_043461194.1 uncharacterized protein LOC122497883 [Leptopilina heterotoma]XP_043461195.1 uncharacterized protein LOC122497883 [Leptopilina heterotoma]XP_043461196.1 uncharacterized protein LOC122497883 [Leptopilina heterotoma]XP_043461197.1 uncharacterized protein LOC122497883 [Leptopilina heterotoma]XP_043461199.1 uncharacterized protein LOC122497883 [